MVVLNHRSYKAPMFTTIINKTKNSICNLKTVGLSLVVTLVSEALLRMVTPGARFRGVTLYDVTPLMKIMSKSS